MRRCCVEHAVEHVVVCCGLTRSESLRGRLWCRAALRAVQLEVGPAVPRQLPVRRLCGGQLWLVCFERLCESRFRCELQHGGSGNVISVPAASPAPLHSSPLLSTASLPGPGWAHTDVAIGPLAHYRKARQQTTCDRQHATRRVAIGPPRLCLRRRFSCRCSAIGVQRGQAASCTTMELARLWLGYTSTTSRGVKSKAFRSPRPPRHRCRGRR